MKVGVGLRKIEVQQSVYEQMFNVLVEVANSATVPLETRQRASAAVKMANALGPSYAERWPSWAEQEKQIDEDSARYEDAKDAGRTK